MKTLKHALFIAILMTSHFFGLDRKNNLSPSFFNEQKTNKFEQKIIFLDVRTFKEYQISHLSNAKWVNEKGEKNSNYISEKDLSKEIIVAYCTLGHRSQTVVNKWRQKGYTNIFNLNGGVIAWVRKGLPIYSNDIPSTYIHSYNYIISWLLPSGYEGVW